MLLVVAVAALPAGLAANRWLRPRLLNEGRIPLGTRPPSWNPPGTPGPLPYVMPSVTRRLL
ncbi:hypothetical protein ACWCO4_36325, partial [Streptomyces virginiae]